MRPRDPHPQRHPRGGGDPGHLSTGATPAASTVVAAWARASSASPRRTVTWIPAFAGMTASGMAVQLKDAKDSATGEIVTTWELKRVMRQRQPHPQRHPRGGGDPGHLSTGATPAASTVVAARARALSVSPRRTVTWIPAFAGMTNRREGPLQRRDRHDVGSEAMKRRHRPLCHPGICGSKYPGPRAKAEGGSGAGSRLCALTRSGRDDKGSNGNS